MWWWRWRRQLLQIETFLCLIVFFTQLYRCSPSLPNNNSQSDNVNQCARIDVRQSWTRLTKQEQQKYISAFQSLSKFQTGGALSFAQKLSILHDSSTLYIHNDLTGQHKAMFFPVNLSHLILYFILTNIPSGIGLCCDYMKKSCRNINPTSLYHTGIGNFS